MLNIPRYDMTSKQLFSAVFNLCQGIDLGAMEAKVAAYQKEHHEEILITEARKVQILKSLYFRLLVSTSNTGTAL